jgi:hypothetical protein
MKHRKAASGLAAMIFLFFGVKAPVLAGQGSVPLPATHGKSVSGKGVTLPASDRPYTLIVAGFTKSSSAPVKAWWEKAQGLCASQPMVACFRVAVLEDVPGFIRGMVVGGIRRDLPPAQQDTFVTVFENESAWKQAFGFSVTDDAYLGLFDSAGKPLWHASGSEAASNSAAIAKAFDLLPR